MPHAKDHLNAKQVNVLAWIAAGSRPDEVPKGDVGHRITAQALVSRGLVTTSGHGPDWTAQITPEGAVRLTRLTAKAEAGAQVVSDGAQLIADVVAAGGVLRVAHDHGRPVDWDARIRSANQTKIRPRGKSLTKRSAGRMWSNDVELYFETNHWDLVEAPRVRQLKRVDAYHPIVRAYLDDPDWQWVTRAHASRAGRLLESLVRAASDAGMTVETGVRWDVPNQTWMDSNRSACHLRLRYGERLYAVRLHEIKGPGSVRRGYGPNADRGLPRWQATQLYTFTSTGRLELEISGPGLGWERTKVRDTRSQRLEDRLPTVLQAVLVGSIVDEERIQRREAEQHDRQLRWAKAMARARTEWADSRRLAVLDARARDWELAQRMSGYLDALDAHPSSERDPRWEEWGRAWLSSVDKYAPLGDFDLPEPTASELQPYLPGWSALGPDVRPVN